MPFPWKKILHLALASPLFLPLPGSAAEKKSAIPKPVICSRRGESMVEVTKIYPTIFYELRYATTRNFTHQQIYPPEARCFLRKSVAVRLQRAQEELRRQGFGLKIWDAYRPAWAHEALWKASPNPEFVASPSSGGSWHTWGAAVDVTLVDRKGREQKMPTDFDDFTVAAKSAYEGADEAVAAHVLALRTAMKIAGFRGLRDEWWHFTAEDAHQFCPVKMALVRGGRK